MKFWQGIAVAALVASTAGVSAQDSPFVPITPPSEEPDESPEPAEEDEEPVVVEVEEVTPPAPPDPVEPVVGPFAPEPEPDEEPAVVDPFEGLDPDFEYLLFPTPGADGEGYLGPFAAPDTLEPCRDPENPEDSYWLAAPGDPWGFLELGPNGPRLWAHQGCMRTGPVPMLGAPQAGDDAFALEGSTTWNASTSSFAADGRDTLTVQISETAIIVHDGDQNVESAWGGRVDLDIDHDNVSEEIGWAESADGTIWISVIRRVNAAPTVTEESHLYGWNDDHGMVRVAFAERSMTRESTDIADGTSTGNTVSGCAENGRLERAEWSRLEASSEFIWFGSDQQLIWTRESSTTESVDADPNAPQCRLQREEIESRIEWSVESSDSLTILLSSSSSDETEEWVVPAP